MTEIKIIKCRLDCCQSKTFLRQIKNCQKRLLQENLFEKQKKENLDFLNKNLENLIRNYKISEENKIIYSSVNLEDPIIISNNNKEIIIITK